MTFMLYSSDSDSSRRLTVYNNKLWTYATLAADLSIQISQGSASTFIRWSGHFRRSFVKGFFRGTILPICIEIGSYLTDKEQKISWYSFLRHSVVPKHCISKFTAASRGFPAKARVSCFKMAAVPFWILWEENSNGNFVCGHRLSQLCKKLQ